MTFEYSKSVFYDPPASRLALNLKRILLLSSAAYKEAADENGIDGLTALTEDDIHLGRVNKNNEKLLTIETESLDAANPNSVRKEIQLRCILRAGVKNPPSIQYERADAYCLVIKRVVERLLVHGANSKELLAGWPANIKGADNTETESLRNGIIKRHIKITQTSIDSLPNSETGAEISGYLCGVRILLTMICGMRN